jgi:hypothetical protein
MGNRESRDANDPRDELRAMNKQAREEFEDEEMDDTGGGAHASRADREGQPAAGAAERSDDQNQSAPR